MAVLRFGTSYWLDAFGASRRRLPSLRGTHDADVAIVGGGVTGCAVAYLFAKAGARVVLLERARIGRGSTAASTALLMQEPDVDFTALSDRYGRAAARRIWQESRAAVRDMHRTLRSLNAPALHGLPSVYLAHHPDAVAALKRELAARHAAGFPGRWLSAASVRRITGRDAPGAILTPGNAQADPYRACLALARAAQKNGARFFERSRVLRIDGRGARARIELPRGRVHADAVVIATGYATPEFKPLAGRFRMMQTYVVGTPRLSPAARRATGLSDVMLWDSERPYHYARWTPDGGLLFGGDDRPQGRRRTSHAQLRTRGERLWQTLTEWYPSLADTRPMYAWEGLFATTSDGLPYIGAHRRYPKHLFALGYGGNGMSFGFLAARLLVRMARGDTGRDVDLFSFNRQRRS